MSQTLRVFSYGGGVQSTACLVLAAQGELDIKTFLFANVGDDSENPATIRYVHDVAIPYAQAHGLAIVEVKRTKRDGTSPTLLQEVIDPTKKGDWIPVHLGGGPPGVRGCTSQFKIAVVAKWLRQHGATESNPAQVHMGISLDEFWRMRSTSGFPYYTLAYPLVKRRLSRSDCASIIERVGLPIPPKSSCWFCPFHTKKQWQTMEREDPALFAQAVELEAAIIAKRASFGKDAAYLTGMGKPLTKLVSKHAQGTLWEEAEPTCDSGFCFM